MDSMTNRVCVLDCLGEGDHSIAARLLAELTGPSDVDCSRPQTWNIDNKYYQAEVAIEVHDGGGGGGGGGEEWEAAIFLCNLSKPSSIQQAYLVWEELAKEATPSVMLLVGVAGPGQKREVAKWCVGKGVELVEWETKPSTDEYPEAVGVARISEALQAHMWPAMTLKAKGPLTASSPPEDRSSSMATSGGDGSQQSTSSGGKGGKGGEGGGGDGGDGGSGDGDSGDGGKGDTMATGASSAAGGGSESSRERMDQLLGMSDVEVLAKGLGESAGDEGEDFETLFNRFAQMKAHAHSLPHEERKAYAEKVVMSFWKAIGGDEEEIEGSSDSDS